MGKYSKWIGGGLGWAFGGPIGALMGFFFGTIIDNIDGNTYEPQTTLAGDFAASLIILTAAIMKADGKVLKSELDFVKAFLIKNFGLDTTKHLLIYLKEVQKKEIDLVAVCNQISMHMDEAARLQLLHYLIALAYADNELDNKEYHLLRKISGMLKISDTDFNSIKAMFETNNEQAYNILEVDSNTDNDTIKKAYRQLAFKYHPDKVAHLGDTYTKGAKEKFQKINEAYEKIKKERNFS